MVQEIVSLVLMTSVERVPSLRESRVDTFHTSPNPLPSGVNFVRPSGQIPRRFMVRTFHRVGTKTTGLPLKFEVVLCESR